MKTKTKPPVDKLNRARAVKKKLLESLPPDFTDQPLYSFTVMPADPSNAYVTVAKRRLSRSQRNRRAFRGKPFVYNGAQPCGY